MKGYFNNEKANADTFTEVLYVHIQMIDGKVALLLFCQSERKCILQLFLSFMGVTILGPSSFNDITTNASYFDIYFDSHIKLGQVSKG